MQDHKDHITEELIIQYLNGDLSDENKAKELGEWLERPENLHEARSIYKTWELTILAAPPRKNIDEAFARLKEHMAFNKNQESKSISFWWYAAASITIISVLIYFLRPNEKPEMSTLIANQRVQEFKLGDGTTITLNEQSTILYSPEELNSGIERVVTLNGVAYFTVVHQPEKPFIVKAHVAEVKVLGTQFMVKTLPEKPTEV